MNPAGETTLGDLMLTLAERMGWHKVPSQADNRSQLPDDPNLRDRLKRAINNGREEIYRRMSTAWCFKPTITITLDPTGASAQNVDGDPAKYRVPFNVQGIAGATWSWRLPSATSGYGGTLQQRHSSDILAMHNADAAATGTSRPVAMALVQGQLNNPSEPGRRTAAFVHIWPDPDQAYVIEGQARIMYAPLTELSDLEPMGQQHSQLVVTAGERDIKLNHPDMTARREINVRFNEQVALSIELDNQNRPQSIGTGYDPDALRQAQKYAPIWDDRSAIVTHVNGISVL